MKMFFPLVFMLCVSCCALAQGANQQPTDTVVQLKEVKVIAPWKNDTERYHYNQMKYYVTTILPYLNAATKLFTEINDKFEGAELTRKERKAFISSKEDDVRTQFEENIRSLNITQGVLLIKLIGRQTGVNIYKMLSEFKNPLAAIKWQAWGSLNGINLNRKYDPADEPELENIMEELGYPLPSLQAYAIKKN